MSTNILLNIVCCVLDIEFSIRGRILLDAIFIAPHLFYAIKTALKKIKEIKITKNQIQLAV